MLKYISKNDLIVKDGCMAKIDTGVQQIMLDEDMDFIDNKKGSINKVVESKELIESSQNLVFQVENGVNECKVAIFQSSVDFDTKKQNFINQTFIHSDELLQKVGIHYDVSSELNRPFELSLDAMNHDYLNIKSISSGRFTGTVLAIITVILTLFVWLYFANQNLDILLQEVNLVSIKEKMDMIFVWITKGIGVVGEPMIGALILAVSLLSMGWLVYALRIYFKSNKNLRIAKKAFIESREYSFVQEGCKKEILSVNGHLRETIVSIENFDCILTEQNGILKRVLHVEGLPSLPEGYHNYHPDSKKVIRDINRLMKTIEDVLGTPITKNGTLNPESQKVLSISKAVYDDYIVRIYG